MQVGGGGVEFLTEKKFPLRNVPGVLKRKKRGGGEKFFPLLNLIFKNVPGVLKRMQKKKIFRGGGILGRPTPPPGGRAGSENDTLLPMTMTCDRLKFWSGPAWRSKVIIRKRKPWRRKKKK